jgi:phosphoribosylamine--glycine ligase
MQVFGPTRKATEIESKEYLQKQTPPIVVKADGLAAGKGVTITKTIPQAQEALANIMELKAFGTAGDRVLIEEHLTGKEMSAFAFSDGTTVIPMVSACDYKQIYDGNQGANTGGMGSYSPPYFTNPTLVKTVEETIMTPAVRAMAEEGRPYRGVLYSGLMITQNGARVLEFNARFGDPETQVVLPLLKTDLVDIMLAVINGKLNQIKVEWSNHHCVGVVMASAGYPNYYKTGFPINGLDDLDKDILVFHGGTKLGGKRFIIISREFILKGATIVRILL